MKKIILLFLFIQSYCFGQQTNNYSVADKSIFKVVAFDFSNQSISQGSGFFVNSNGVGVTNMHVLDNVDSAYIETSDGKKYEIINILDFSSKYDIIKFKTKTSNSNPVVISQKKPVRGDDVFALGYPCGMEITGGSTLSKGIISAQRQIDSVDFIQTSAQITHGSSGGGLFDTKGELIGITQGTFASDIEDIHANLYKVIPAKYISLLTKNRNLTFQDLKKLNININLAKFESLKNQGDLINAELYITEMLKNDVLNARLWNKYASILGLHKLNQKELAFNCYENAIKLDPNNVTYYANYSLCCSEYSMTDKAFEILNNVNKPTSESHFYYALGYCLTSSNKYNEAIESYQKSIDLFDVRNGSYEVYPKLFYELAYCYKKIGNYKLSLQKCDIVIMLFPDYYTPYLLRAQVNYVLDDVKSSCDDINYVIENAIQDVDQYWREIAIELKSDICN